MNNIKLTILIAIIGLFLACNSSPVSQVQSTKDTDKVTYPNHNLGPNKTYVETDFTPKQIKDSVSTYFEQIKYGESNIKTSSKWSDVPDSVSYRISSNEYSEYPNIDGVDKIEYEYRVDILRNTNTDVIIYGYRKKYLANSTVVDSGIINGGVYHGFLKDYLDETVEDLKYILN